MFISEVCFWQQSKDEAGAPCQGRGDHMPLKFKPLPSDPFGQGEVIDEGGIVPDVGGVFTPIRDPALELWAFLRKVLAQQPADLPPEPPERPAHRVRKRGVQ